MEILHQAFFIYKLSFDTPLPDKHDPKIYAFS